MPVQATKPVIPLPTHTSPLPHTSHLQGDDVEAQLDVCRDVGGGIRAAHGRRFADLRRAQGVEGVWSACRCGVSVGQGRGGKRPLVAGVCEQASTNAKQRMTLFLGPLLWYKALAEAEVRALWLAEGSITCVTW